MNRTLKITIAMILSAGIYLMGCGGGSGSSSGGGTVGGGISYPSKILSWIPPSYYTDGSPLNPASDIDIFEIYVRTDTGFSSTDTPLAALQAVDPGTGTFVTSFDLSSLASFISPHVNYYVAIRAVARNGMKSDFSQSASFSF